LDSSIWIYAPNYPRRIANVLQTLLHPAVPYSFGGKSNNSGTRSYHTLALNERKLIAHPSSGHVNLTSPFACFQWQADIVNCYL
jgi:hypothetical protein